MTEHVHDLPNYFSTGSDEERAAARRVIGKPARAPIGDRANGSDEHIHIHIRTPPTWPKPKPLPDGLLPVKAFALDYLPESVAPWVGDISDRMQCPPDFVGVAAMVALGAE